MAMYSSYYPLPIPASGLHSPPPMSPKKLSCCYPQSKQANSENACDEKETGKDASGSGFTKHDDLWFCDGSVVLRAENTIFRVHKSQLSRHSAFFHDLFSLPQPHHEKSNEQSRAIIDRNSSSSRSSAVLEVDSENEIEGCPVIYLHDSAEDVENLLTALYDGPDFGNNDHTDFRTVSGILRLSTKYLVDTLRTKSLSHLSTAWPSTLKMWDAREDVARAHELTTGLGVAHLYPSPIAVINLAREVNEPSLLPSAFYDLSRYHYTQIFEPNEEDEGPSHSSRGAIVTPLPLSGPDMQKLMLGKEATQNAITSLIQSMGTSSTLLHLPYSPSQHTHAHSHRACRRDFSELVALATQHYLFDRERGCTDPLYVADELGQLKSAEFSECEACARALEMWAARERERMWKMIPLWFRLEI
ncbi:hypothetical protein SERLADRAFT_476777 [Serpula lacrymans var. lacrymans S7.9]|uniref:BTB domain-containing protein n=1 Tax=Serpula lacrymans var. lacrymans (strain S7.9) TaxID=578457 RepID=F8P7W0_SERL9|nr:uncharacterized protein SERLADRAFT_476777 [Serpula lacrymans var. lacrymans S7.9]EGO20518.1 hypothetical protein SERLADRAFT_476777 [Serpula lacrymans var. lacrymans S7.9]